MERSGDEYCCEAFAVAYNQRQIVWSMDEGIWVVSSGAFGEWVLMDIRRCPWCGDGLPDGTKEYGVEGGKRW